MLSLETFEQLLSGKNITELCTLKNAFEMLAGGRSIDSVAAAEWAYLKGQLAVIEKGMWSILTGGSTDEASTEIGNITNVDTAEKVKAQMEVFLKDGIERGVEQPIIDKLNTLIDLAASKVTELASGVKDKAADIAEMASGTTDSVSGEEEAAEKEVPADEMSAVCGDANVAVSSGEMCSPS